MALPLMSAEVPQRSIEEYMMFFRHCTKRSAAQWQVVLRRTYPWFQPFRGGKLLRDLPFRGCKPPNYHLGGEVYDPNFCTRQFGYPQLIPLKSYRSCNRGTSWRDANYLDLYKVCSYAEFDAWWKARFTGLPYSSSAMKVLFDGCDSWAVYAGAEAKKFMVQMIKDINAQVIEDPSMTRNLGGQAVQAGEVFATSVITAGDLDLPFGDEEDYYETLVEPIVEATPTRKNKRKKTTQAQDIESASPPSKVKRLRKRVVSESEWAEEPAVVPTKTTETNEELRKAFEAIEQEKEVSKVDKKKEKKKKRKFLLNDQPFQPPIVAMPIHSSPGSSATTSFADPELEEFEAMDLDAQLDKLEKISSTPGRATSKVVHEAVDRVKIWQSNELDLDENSEVVDHEAVDLLHSENMAPRPILELNLGLARDVLNPHHRCEDLKPSFKASEFCKATHEANLGETAFVLGIEI
ncbi:unnamed protein product [Prunus armeniaca]